MAGHNRLTCSALQDAIVDVVAKRKALAVAEEKKSAFAIAFRKGGDCCEEESEASEWNKLGVTTGDGRRICYGLGL